MNPDEKRWFEERFQRIETQLMASRALMIEIGARQLALLEKSGQTTEPDIENRRVELQALCETFGDMAREIYESERPNPPPD